MVKELMRLGYRRRESIFGAPYDFRKAPSENSLFTGLHFSSAFGISSILRTNFLQFIFVNANILENRRRVMKKNVAILADSLPLSASRHNTMFLKKLATSPVCLF